MVQICIIGRDSTQYSWPMPTLLQPGKFLNGAQECSWLATSVYIKLDGAILYYRTEQYRIITAHACTAAA